ncbi:hypothetical protein EF908_12660, partial [Streptomyces sp. WAC04770]
PSGAAAVLARSAETAPWEDSGWTTTWLAEAASREPARGLLLRDQYRRQPREQPGVTRLGRRVAEPGHRAHQPLRGGGGQEHGQRGVFGGREVGSLSV